MVVRKLVAAAVLGWLLPAAGAAQELGVHVIHTSDVRGTIGICG